MIVFYPVIHVDLNLLIVLGTKLVEEKLCTVGSFFSEWFIHVTFLYLFSVHVGLTQQGWMRQMISRLMHMPVKK